MAGVSRGGEAPEARTEGPGSRQVPPLSHLSAGGGQTARKSRGSCGKCTLRYVPAASPVDEVAISAVLSAARFSTYLAETGDLHRAMALYGWNARISAALMLPAHFAEVVTRNAAAGALETVYGPEWPWSKTFRKSLPGTRSRAYNARCDLERVAEAQATTGKVIAELKFAFWQNLFTARHDARLWEPQIATLFPFAEGTPRQVRRRIYDDLEQIRRLRNRIAHHEPIISRDIAEDLRRMIVLVGLRCPEAARWVTEMEDVSSILAERP